MADKERDIIPPLVEVGISLFFAMYDRAIGLITRSRMVVGKTAELITRLESGSRLIMLSCMTDKERGIMPSSVCQSSFND